MLTLLHLKQSEYFNINTKNSVLKCLSINLIFNKGICDTGQIHKSMDIYIKILYSTVIFNQCNWLCPVHYVNMFFISCFSSFLHLLLHEGADEVHGDGEDHSGVPLCGDFSQGLQVAQLQSSRRLWHHMGRFLQSTGRLHLSLSSYHLYRGHTRMRNTHTSGCRSVYLQFLLTKIPVCVYSMRKASSLCSGSKMLHLSESNIILPRTD